MRNVEHFIVSNNRLCPILLWQPIRPHPVSPFTVNMIYFLHTVFHRVLYQIVHIFIKIMIWWYFVVEKSVYYEMFPLEIMCKRNYSACIYLSFIACPYYLKNNRYHFRVTSISADNRCSNGCNLCSTSRGFISTRL